MDGQVHWEEKHEVSTSCHLSTTHSLTSSDSNILGKLFYQDIEFQYDIVTFTNI